MRKGKAYLLAELYEKYGYLLCANFSESRNTIFFMNTELINSAIFVIRILFTVHSRRKETYRYKYNFKKIFGK